MTNNDPTNYRVKEVLAGFDRGWSFTPLRGKIPTLAGWPNAERETRETAEAWARSSNIGLRTGDKSGLVAIDFDPGSPSPGDLGLPATWTVGTGREGGLHLYYRLPDGAAIGNSAGRLAPHVDVKSTGGQVVFVGSVHPQTGRVYTWQTGRSPDDLALADLPADIVAKLAAPEPHAQRPTPPPERLPSHTNNGDELARVLAEARRYVSRAKPAAEGTRNSAAFALAGHVLAFEHEGTGQRLAEPEALDLMREWNGRCTPPLPESELLQAVRSAAQNGTARTPHAVRTNSRPASTRATTATSEQPNDDAITVRWIADRFVQQHGQNLRYCPPTRTWYFWDGSRWAADELGRIHSLASDTLRSIRGEAAQEKDKDRREKMFALGCRLDSAAGYSQIIDTAATRPGIAIRPAELDADAWKLNALNGVVNLKTGELQPHARELLMSKIADAEFRPDAKHEMWDRFLERVQPDAEIRSFGQRAVGYSLIGDTPEEVFFLPTGPTASGKSTYVESIKATLGDYATTCDFETFLSRQASGGPRNDIARLAGRRLVLSIEVDEGARLAQGLVKSLTGGDTISARFLYQEAFEFRPAFKLWLVCNHPPRASHDDDALWRRVLLLPFNEAIPEAERDPEVKYLLRTDPEARAAVLAWAVRGCLTWQAQRLNPPDAVRLATSRYRDDQNDLEDFITDYCLVGDGLWCPSKDLRFAYDSYCRASGVTKPMSPRSFWLRLGTLGFKAEARSRARGWSGIAVCPMSGADARYTSGVFSSNSPTRAHIGKVTESAVSGVSGVTNPPGAHENGLFHDTAEQHLTHLAPVGGMEHDDKEEATWTG